MSFVWVHRSINLERLRAQKLESPLSFLVKRKKNSKLNKNLVDAEIDLSDFVAPTAASPFQSRPGKQRAIILPYSLYQRRLEEQSRLRNQSKPKLTSTATNQQYSGGLLEDKLVSIYLPSFKDANQSQIAEEADALQRFVVVGYFNVGSIT